MPVLTIREIYDVARAAGFGEQQAVTWTAIALAQSGGRTGELNARGESEGGLWRINAIPGVDGRRWGDLENPRNNARAAFEISRRGLDPGPWTATRDAAAGIQTDYRTQLGRVEQEIGILGDGRGPANGSTAPPPSSGASSSYDRIDQGGAFGPAATPWTQAGALPTIGGTAGDSDHDGLSDVFERLVGTDAARVDSDGDGLTDGYEASTGTDPLSTDTDRDGFTDGLEVGQRGDPLTPDGAGAVPRWTIESGSQRRLAALSTTPQPAQPGALAQQPGPTTQVPAPAPGPARDLNGGRVSADGVEPKLVASLDAAGHGNWQGAVKAGNHWFLAQAGAGDKFQVFHRLDASGKALDQMKVVGAAHTTSFAVVGNTVYATNDGEVVTFPYQPGATIDASNSTPTGWRGFISIDPTQRFAVIRRGNHYRAYDLETREQIGKEVITPTGQRQGFSIVGDALYVLTGKTNSPGRVDSFSFTTGEHTGTQDVTGVGPGRHREPEGMFGDLMGVKTGLGSARRLNIYQLDTGIAPATEAPPVTDQPPPADPSPAAASVDDGGSAADLGPVAESDHGGGGEHADDAGDDGDHVTFGGKTVDRRTASMLAEAERLANEEDPSIGRFNLTQGSFSHSVGASAGTHDGPGAFDMYTRSYSATQKETIGLALRQVGFASWLRRKSQGPWDEHWHGIAMGTKGLPSVAESQVQNYLDGLNGLRGNGKDTDRRPDEIRTWEEYREQQGSVDHNPATQPAMDPSGNRFDIAGGQRLDPGLDSDADGLTDVFERLAQSDSGRADTDGDGLLDGYEVGTSRSDPLLIDSDLDGFTDAAELRFGGNPLGTTTSGTPALGSDPLGSDPLGTDPLGTDPVGAGEPQPSSGGLLDP